MTRNEVYAFCGMCLMLGLLLTVIVQPSCVSANKRQEHRQKTTQAGGSEVTAGGDAWTLAPVVNLSMQTGGGLALGLFSLWALRRQRKITDLLIGSIEVEGKNAEHLKRNIAQRSAMCGLGGAVCRHVKRVTRKS